MPQSLRFMGALPFGYKQGGLKSMMGLRPHFVMIAISGLTKTESMADGRAWDPERGVPSSSYYQAGGRFMKPTSEVAKRPIFGAIVGSSGVETPNQRAKVAEYSSTDVVGNKRP